MLHLLMSGTEIFAQVRIWYHLFSQAATQSGFITKSTPQLDCWIRIFTADGYVQTSLPSMPCTSASIDCTDVCKWEGCNWSMYYVHWSYCASIICCWYQWSGGLTVLFITVKKWQALLYCLFQSSYKWESPDSPKLLRWSDQL